MLLTSRSLLLAACLFALIGVLPINCLAAETVRINGSGSCLDMLKPFVEAYGKINRAVLIEIEKPLGSSGALKALLSGALDAVASSKALKPEEIAKGALQREYGRTPLAIVTEKNVRKMDITTKELEEIYAGKTTKWQNGESIRLILRPSQDIDTHILKTLSPGMSNAVNAAHSRPGMIVAVTDPEAYTAVSKTPGGIGATGLTSIITEKLPLNVLSLNGVAPTPRNLASGTYPLFKEISFVTTPRTTPAALKFIDFVYSPQGRAIADKTGVVVSVKSRTDK
ncbi:MAG: substrate-binding domain-containing protein [Deltaproteobacteria bacterium]|nr:substrate-binding domain-containing protein [Deltaproteobacteria bacterium]